MMRNRIVFSVILFAAALLGVSCKKGDQPDPKPDPVKLYKVVSHRGGYSESSLPACCIQGLTYSHNIGCYAAECDIVITQDGRALVAHPDDNGKVNGLVPHSATLAQIRAAGKLKNGEQIPVIEDFVDWLIDPKKNSKGMKIWIDTKAWSNLDLTVQAINVAYAAIKAKDACKYCEFIIPNSGDLFARVKNTDLYKEGKCMVGWMADGAAKLLAPTFFEPNTWHQTKYTAIIPGQDIVTPPFKVDDYFNANVPLSIWCTSSQGTEKSKLLDVAIDYYPNKNFKAFFVNYPKAAIDIIKKAGY